MISKFAIWALIPASAGVASMLAINLPAASIKAPAAATIHPTPVPSHAHPTPCSPGHPEWCPSPTATAPAAPTVVTTEQPTATATATAEPTQTDTPELPTPTPCPVGGVAWQGIHGQVPTMFDVPACPLHLTLSGCTVPTSTDPGNSTFTFFRFGNDAKQYHFPYDGPLVLPVGPIQPYMNWTGMPDCPWSAVITYGGN